MRQIFFIVILICMGTLAFFRPVYSISPFYSTKCDFENISWIGMSNNSGGITRDKAYSGEHSARMDSSDLWGFIYQVNAAYLPSDTVFEVKVKARLHASEVPEGLMMVFQCQKMGQPAFVWGEHHVSPEKGVWTEVEHTFGVGKRLKPEDEIAVYFCRKVGKEIIYVDDIEVYFYN